jgi:hypothetical protein
VVEEKPNKISLFAVLRIRDVYPRSRIRIFPSRISDPGSNKFPIQDGSGSAFKYFYPKKFPSSRSYDPGCYSRIPGPDLDFLPIPDPGLKTAPDPGSGSLLTGQRNKILVYIPWTECRGAEWSSVSLCPMSRCGAGTAFTSPGTLSFPQFAAVLRIRIRIRPKMSWIRNTGL